MNTIDLYKLIQAGEVPSNDQLVEFMKMTHDRDPAGSERYFLRPDEAGKTGYEQLAKFYRTNKKVDSSVLDLGCGVGTLWPRLTEDGLETVPYIGADVSPVCISSAADRFRFISSAQFVEAQATDLPFSENSFDFVLSHMALMLMKPATKVMQEVSRVLKPNGYFAAVIPAAGRRPAVFNEALSGAICDVIGKVYPNQKKNSGGFGIEEYASKDSISKLISETAGLSGVKFFDFDVDFSVSKTRFISELGSFYVFDIMPEGVKAKALSDIQQYLDQTHEGQAVVPFHRAFVLISSRKI